MDQQLTAEVRGSMGQLSKLTETYRSQVDGFRGREYRSVLARELEDAFQKAKSCLDALRQLDDSRKFELSRHETIIKEANSSLIHNTERIKRDAVQEIDKIRQTLDGLASSALLTGVQFGLITNLGSEKILADATVGENAVIGEILNRDIEKLRQFSPKKRSVYCKFSIVIGCLAATFSWMTFASFLQGLLVGGGAAVGIFVFYGSALSAATKAAGAIMNGANARFSEIKTAMIAKIDKAKEIHDSTVSDAKSQLKSVGEYIDRQVSDSDRQLSQILDQFNNFLTDWREEYDAELQSLSGSDVLSLGNTNLTRLTRLGSVSLRFDEGL